MRKTDESPIEFGWTGSLVRHRLLEAMRTLAKMPNQRNPQRMQSGWPDDTYARDPGAIETEKFVMRRYELELPEKEQEARRREHLKNWMKTPPSPGQIANMEQSLLWPGRYLDEPGRRFMNLWAFHLGVENNTKPVRFMFGISRKSMWERANKLSDKIADRLNADGVAVL